ncbi:m157 protein [Murid betaherpesvirus 1]|nr:m157 protein [Murid betaherpesvirus 1]
MLLTPLVKFFLTVCLSGRVASIFNPNPVVNYMDVENEPIKFTMEFEVTVTRNGLYKHTISVDSGRPVVIWEDGDEIKVCKICPALGCERAFLNSQINHLNELLEKDIKDTYRICVRYMCMFNIFGFGCDVYHTTDTVRVSYRIERGQTDIQGQGMFPNSDVKGTGLEILDNDKDDIRKRWWPTVQKLKQLGCMNEIEVEFWYDTTGPTCVVTSRSSVPFIVELSLNDNSSVTVTDDSTVDYQTVTLKAPGSHVQRCYVASSLGWKGVVTPPSSYRTKRVPVNISSSKWTGIVNWIGNVNRSTASYSPNLTILVLCAVFIRLVVV